MKLLEFKEENKLKICKFYAYNLECPDMTEFKDCAFQHDELIVKAHKSSKMKG